MKKRTQSRSTIACPTPLVLFGIDSRGKPKAARFGKQHASLALKAATQLQLQVLAGNDPKIADLDRSGAGRPGPCHWPDLRAVHSPRSLRSACLQRRETGPPILIPRRTDRQARLDQRQVARRLTCRKLAGDRARRSGHRKQIAVRRAGTRQSSFSVDGDMLTLRWRDYPRERRIVRHRFRLGLLYPNATVGKGSPAKTSGHAKHDKPAAAHPVANDQSLPKNWDEIDINHVVLAKDDSQWGAWWEAIPVEKAGDGFKLRWREKYAANVPLITRPRLDLALICPNAA